MAASAITTYRVWCVTWEDDEHAGINICTYDTLNGSPPADTVHALWEPTYVVRDAEDAAERYADYVHSHRDGWESSWPLTFRVKVLPGGAEEDYEVDREAVPQFTARKKG